MRLYGWDAINYAKGQGGQLNMFTASGVEFDVSIETAEQAAATNPSSVWTDVDNL